MKNFIPKHVKFGYCNTFVPVGKRHLMFVISRKTFRKRYPNCYKAVNFYCSIMLIRSLKPLKNVNIITISSNNSSRYNGFNYNILGCKGCAIMLPRKSNDKCGMLYWSYVIAHEDEHANLGIGIKYGQIKAYAAESRFIKFIDKVCVAIQIVYPKNTKIKQIKR